MFDLKPCIDFEKIEIVARHVINEFDRAGGFVIHLFPQRDGGLAQTPAHGVGKARRRGFLHHFLIAALERAIAFAERHDPALAVAENLYFDMARARDETFEKEARVAKARPCGALDALEFFAQGFRAFAKLHADAAAAGGAFQHHRIGNALGLGQSMFEIVEQARAGQQRRAGLLRDLARRVLQAESPQMFGTRADEGDSLRREPFREADIFRQEAIAGMDRLRAGLAAGVEDRVDAQIAFARRRGPDPDPLVGLQNRPREAVGVGIDRDALHPHPAQAFPDPADDFAPVGDQNLVEHLRPPARPRSAPAPASDGSRCMDC